MTTLEYIEKLVLYYYYSVSEVAVVYSGVGELPLVNNLNHRHLSLG